MSREVGDGCVGLEGACVVDHVKFPGAPHSAFGFAVTLDERGGVQAGAELVELDPEEKYPRAWEVWANIAGSCLELTSPGEIAGLQKQVHAFLQGLAPLAARLADTQAGSDPMRDADWGAGFFGQEHCARAPGDGAGVVTAQLFWGDSPSCVPVVSFFCPGFSADLGADQTRAFARRLRRMADDADVLAARLDGLEDRTAVTAAVGAPAPGGA
ncbi:hypothetical protein ACFYOG_33180 [Streptomyces sp. NPDC007818]|uniref:hypothetical protein n=1 Tax=Streptomyces sp. NPDC007818 TaxID=3364780 RepID=UPI0036B3F7E6